MVVLDVGGGPGTYACWLAGLGHEVHLVDASALHVDQARATSALLPARQLASARVGDARRLDQSDASVQAVRLLGPLYHLIVVGTVDPAVPRHLGFEVAASVEEAVARAETIHGRDC